MAKKDDTLETVAKVGAIAVVGFFALRALMKADQPRDVQVGAAGEFTCEACGKRPPCVHWVPK